MPTDDARESLPSIEPRFELNLTEDYSQYLLHSRAEIRAVLRSIVQKGALTTVHFDEGRYFFLTSLIGFSPDNEQIVLDVGSNEEMNERALRADKLIFTAIVDKVKIQFRLDGLRRVSYEGRPAFAGAVPDQLLRLQRREFFRLSTPVANPIRLNVALAPGGKAVNIPLLDISGGGVGLMVPPDLAGLLEKGQILKDCRIALPGEGLLDVDLCVRNMFEVTNRGGSRYLRVGCEFADLSPAQLTAVQRFIINTERERKAKMV
jgi:c-di-GMP-binding flagellar brake protein YcgR